VLRIRIDINGSDIAEIGVHNKQTYDDEGRVKYGIYDLRGFSGHHIDEAPRIETVYHERSDGARELTRRVMDAISDKHFD